MAEAHELLVGAAIRYALARLGDVTSAQTLAQLLGVALPNDAGVVDTVQGKVSGAAAHAQAAADALGDPPDVAVAGQRLWDALVALRAAAVLLGAPDAADAVAGVLTASPPHGPVERLALAAPRAHWDDAGLLVGWRSASSQELVPGTRVARVGFEVRVGPEGLSATLALGGLATDLALGADGVLRTLVGSPAGVTADVDVTVSAAGPSTHGTAGPVAVPARADLGVAALESLALAVRPEGELVDVVLRGRLAASLGPLAASVDGLEVAFPVDPATLLAGADFPEPRPGTGLRAVGLSLDVAVARGGGSLARAPGGGYGGVLELRLGPVDVKAFGILREHDGTASFVAVMSVELDPAVELGFGFTLNGVGGILGHGITLDPTALAAGMHDGAIADILFPPDPVASAPRILGTLAAVFPPRHGGFVVGPMLALGWGRPTLVRLDVAVVLALPDPVVAILGRARVAIPDPAAPVIDLRASLLAALGNGMVLVRAQLEASRIGTTTVQGGFGMLTRFEGTPTAVVSAGGFHPRYTQVPGELAGLDRISAELAPPAGFQMRLSGYVAVTPNTLQLGGSVEIGYSVGVAAVRGGLGLDVLVHLDPFALEADVVAKVDVEALGESVAGVDLALHVRGPGPWEVQGTGRVRLPWPLPDPSISVGPITFGDRAVVPEVEGTSPLDVAKRALSDTSAWRPRQRSGFAPPVTLAPPDPAVGADSGRTPLEPWALLQATQREVPLELRVDRIGRHRATPGPCAVHVAEDPKVGGLPGATWSHASEAFATAQFVDLTDDEALGAPDFEQRAAGVVVDPSGTRDTAGPAVGADLAYEDVHPFEPTPAPPGRVPWFDLPPAMRGLALAHTACGASTLRSAVRYAEEPRGLHVQPASAVRVADLDTGAALTGPDADVTGLAPGFAAWTDAAAAARGAGLSTLHLTKTGW